MAMISSRHARERALRPGGPLVVMGHSLGGVVSVGSLLSHPELDGAALLARQGVKQAT